MRRMGRVTAAGAIALTLMAACGDSGGAGAGGSPSGAGGSGATGATGRNGSGYGGGGGSTGSSGSGGGGGVSVRTVTQVNYQFAPPKVTVTSGDVITVSDTNPSTPHTFTVEGTSIDVSNNPQQSQDVTIDLDPGTYVFFCRFHRSQGMEGTLVVK
jgi:plastocyanin